MDNSRGQWLTDHGTGSEFSRHWLLVLVCAIGIGVGVSALPFYTQGIINFRGAYRDSLFTDEKGHQGKIVVTTGTLIWLSALYGVDLTTNDFDTGFNTDLHSIAESVINSHDPNY